MDQIRLSIEKIADLSEEELSSLKENILSEYETLKGTEPTKDSVDQLTELASFADALVNELSRRETERAELSAAVEDAGSRISQLATEPEEVSEETSEEVEEASEEGETAQIPTPSEDDEDEVVVPEETVPSNEEETPSPEDSETVPDAETPSEEEEEAPVVDGEEEEDIDPITGLPRKSTAFNVTEATVTDSTVELASEEPETHEVEPTVTELSVAEESTPHETSTEPVEQSELNTESEITEEIVTTSDINTEGLVVEVPESHRVAPKISTSVAITAGADIPNVTAGSPLPNLRAVAQAILDRKKGMGRTSGGDGEQHTVASFTVTYPEDRVLRTNDFDLNSDKIRSVVSEPALVAGGGLLAPVETSYDIFGLGELGRPVKDSLAVFAADRGGIRYITPPVLTDLDGAVSLWTIDDDEDAATEGAPDPVKPCIRVSAGTPVEVFTDAIPLCLTFGNMGARAYPEMVERHIQLGMINHARYAETRLLTRIGALSTSVSSASELGAARDVLVDVEQAAAAYRSRHRMNPNAKLRVIFPEWFKNALRADLTKQLPGDGQEVTFKLTEAAINSWFAARDIQVTWALDGETGQIFGSQAAGALVDFPSTVIWYLFSEGTFLFLDGSTLDLGIVRDSTLNGTNDYKIFLETFEGVAKVGIESLRVSTSLIIAGGSAATVATIA